MKRRFTLIDCRRSLRNDLADAVKTGLEACPKSLPCRFFYDHEGSLLFEKICELPEYYVTRAETEIFRDRVEEIAVRVPENITLVELGSGSASKTRILIEELIRRQKTLCYVPIDISQSALEESSKSLLGAHPSLEINAIAGEYHDGLRQLAAESAGTKLILWLGSNIGNLDRSEAAEFLQLVRKTMGRQDRFLIGIDLRKSPQVLQVAYDDSAGITARFNLNILARINRELGGHFDLTTFRHRAVYKDEIGRIEMYLVSAVSQQVSIDGAKLLVSFAEDEHIHTENSYKYSLAEIQQLAAASNLRLEHQWFDSQGRFSLNLLALDE